MPRPSKPHLHKGYWRVRIDGEEIHLGKDKRQAMREFHAMMAKRTADDLTDRPQTINGAVMAWLKLHDSSSYSNWLAPFRAFAGDEYLDSVERDMVARYHLHLKSVESKRAVYDADSGGYTAKPTGNPLSAQTLRSYIRSAVAVLRWAHDQGWCNAAPILPKLPKTDRVDRSLKDGDVGATFDAMAKRSRTAALILRFIRATGARPGEACKLEWKHVQADRGICVLPLHKTSAKTGKPRIIYLTPDAAKVLTEAREARGMTIVPLDGYVFRNRTGKPYKPNGLRSILRRYADGATPYQLRHSFAQAGSDSGLAPDVLAKLMGHAKIETTGIYYEVSDARASQAAQGLTLKRASVG